jgi:DNA-binding CsgD family transcriptional regulator
LARSAGEVARIVPSLRRTLQVESLAPDNPEDDRLRLISGILDCLRNIGALHPLLLVLEDLHDADRGSLDLLLYLARHLEGSPLLVVGTYRDVEVDRAHPLAAALAELRRVSQFERVHLGELSVDEIQRLLASRSQQAVPRSLAELVHYRSGGNALFVHELLRYLLNEGLVVRRDGVLRRVGEEASLAGEMPEGLRDVVGKRLLRLSPAANQVLSVAAVIGREFELEVLRRVHARADDELESALAESVRAAILQERSVIGTTITYRFSHAFFQQTLYDEIVAPRRIRLHQQVARVLEDIHRRRVDDCAAELAEHYAFSADSQDLAKAVHYGELAARRATDVFAYGEAARQLERALVVQDLVDPDDRAKRCDLPLSLGEALFPAGENERVIMHVAPDALSLAESMGDRSRAFHAARLALDSLFASGPPYIASQPAYLAWAERAARYAAPASVERCHADLALSTARFSRGQFAQARELRLEALALARLSADPELLFGAAFLHMGQLDVPRHLDERLALVDECAGWPHEGVSSTALGNMLMYSAKALLAQGERARAEDLWRQLRELAERTHVASVRMFAAWVDVQLAVMDGHLEDGWARFNRIAAQTDESPPERFNPVDRRARSMSGSSRANRGDAVCVARHLGDAAALVGDSTAARGYYTQALESTGRIRFCPELALTHLRLAELLLKEPDAAALSESLEHLNIAIPELRDMKMQPGLERALALRANAAPTVAKSTALESAADGLTAREREIARLVAVGRSNREIADALVITEGTVEVHVKHILSKLGLQSRTQVAPWLGDHRSEKPADSGA